MLLAERSGENPEQAAKSAEDNKIKTDLCFQEKFNNSRTLSFSSCKYSY
jgi:hypothetical protein